MSELNSRPYAGVVFPDEWDQDEGHPDINSVALAIQIWTMFNPPYRHSVRKVGEVFNLDDAQVRQAVEAHYWMYLDGPDDNPHQQFIEHDGE
jgi:hypothetical protein